MLAFQLISFMCWRPIAIIETFIALVRIRAGKSTTKQQELSIDTLIDLCRLIDVLK